MVEKITIWKKRSIISSYYAFEFSHIESGWSEYNMPKPKSKLQEGWICFIWTKQFGYLVDGHVQFDQDYKSL